MKRTLSTLVACAALALAGNVTAADYKACFVYVGSKTDGGWTQAHDIGRLEAEKHFGGKV